MKPSPAPSRRGHSIWGRVIDPNGGAVPHAEIFWIHGDLASQETVDVFEVHKVAQADAQGRFWAPDLPEGPCLLVPDHLRMSIADSRLSTAGATARTVPSLGDDDLTLVFPHLRTEFGTILGVVRDETGRPASRVNVSLADAAGTALLVTVATDRKGRFEFPLLRHGHYRIVLWGTAHHLDGVMPVELMVGKRAELTMTQSRRPDAPRHSIRVRVESHLGLPIPRARVEVTVPKVTVSPKFADGKGVCEIGGLPARPILVIAKSPGYWPDGAHVPAGEEGEAAEVTVVLPRAVRLRIVAEDAATGRVVRHANIHVAHSGGDDWNMGGVLPPPDEPPPKHVFAGVRPGPVTVRAESPGLSRAEASFEIPEVGEDLVSVVLKLEARA